MYKDKEQQKEANKEASQRRRDKQKGMTQGMTSEGMTGQGMTYPAIIVALADPVKRKKLECITQELKNHNVLESVRYGIGGPTFDIVEKYLSVLK